MSPLSAVYWWVLVGGSSERTVGVAPLAGKDGVVVGAAHVVVCARIARNGLVAAECERLTGSRPNADGVAFCDVVDEVRVSAFVRSGLRVITRGASLEAVIDAVREQQFAADRFRVEVHDPSARLARPAHDVAVALADVMPYGPDLDDPQHRFVVIPLAGEVLFCEVVAEADGAYRLHDAKPWSTSSSLDARFSRALVNLVPSGQSILDPCCGAGSIVLEAASLGRAAFGLDWKPAMVGMTQQNLDHFGYAAKVVRADSRTHVQRADAIVTDLPYGHAIQTDEATVRAILEQLSLIHI